MVIWSSISVGIYLKGKKKYKLSTAFNNHIGLIVILKLYLCMDVANSIYVNIRDLDF